MTNQLQQTPQTTDNQRKTINQMKEITHLLNQNYQETTTEVGHFSTQLYSIQDHNHKQSTRYYYNRNRNKKINESNLNIHTTKTNIHNRKTGIDNR